MPEERFASHDGVRIRYLDNSPGSPEGAPIVFVPGVSDGAEEYVEVLDHLMPRRMVVVEVRGRGGSDSPPEGYAAADHAADVVAVIEQEALPAFHLMTFSRGTTSGLDAALAFPDRVRSISIGDYLPVEVQLKPEVAEGIWAGRWRGVPTSERIGRHVMEGLQCNSRARELWDAVAGLGVPVLVGRSAEGGLVGDEVEQRYRDRIPGVEVATVSAKGHDLFRESRTAYPDAVVEFIRRRCPGS